MNKVIKLFNQSMYQFEWFLKENSIDFVVNLIRLEARASYRSFNMCLISSDQVEENPETIISIVFVSIR